ncbi:MAG TPA: nicotinate-nucleotide adenylyltransferase [Dehalococcoidia bacterium]|jgi:nicotinate-nucleotide adenylyltransferase
MKVGILGGTFDPVHNGHLTLAASAQDALQLDTVLFIPAGDPWRKNDRQITPAAHRLAMLRLAIESNDAFGVSDIELRRDGPTYTADTLEALAGERLDDEFYFIIGADALEDLPNWHEPERIVEHAMLAVAPRDTQDVNSVAVNITGVAERIVTFDMPRVAVSSTEIRERAAAGKSVHGLVPDAVERYIREQGLYEAG